MCVAQSCSELWGVKCFAFFSSSVLIVGDPETMVCRTRILGFGIKQRIFEMQVLVRAMRALFTILLQGFGIKLFARTDV